MISSLIDSLWGQLYQVVVGKFYQAETLGQYTRARGYCAIFSSNLTNIIQRVTFPVLAEMQDDKKRLKEGYRRIIKVSMLLSFTSMLMMCAVSKPLIIIMIGEKWTQSAYFLQIICWGSMLYPLHALNLNMLQVLGRSDLFLGLEIIKKIIAVGPIMLGIFVGIYAMLIGSLFAGFLCFFLNSYYSGPLLNYSSKQQILDILPSFSIAFTGALCAYFPAFLYELFAQEANWSIASFILLPIQLLIGLIVLYELFEKKQYEEYLEMKNILINAISKLKFHNND